MLSGHAVYRLFWFYNVTDIQMNQNIPQEQNPWMGQGRRYLEAEQAVAYTAKNDSNNVFKFLN